MAGQLVVVTGPTASGKTTWAIQLAQHLDTEVISFDSRQLYREMTIGTAKPTAAELAKVPHHGVNSHPITEPQSAASFTAYLLPIVTDLLNRKGVAVAVGGSGLYLKALLGGFDSIPAKDPQLRAKLEQQWQQEGLAPLLQQLQALDPVYFAAVDQHNPHRVIRALEVCLVSGRPFSDQRTGEGQSRDFTALQIGVAWPREALYERINTRVDQMLAHGLLQEAQRLHPQRGLSSLETVGYTELFDYLEGRHDWEEAVRLIKRNTRRYAKRQLTWFRKQPVTWFAPDDYARAEAWIDQQLAP